jgi:hypothetical protein
MGQRTDVRKLFFLAIALVIATLLSHFVESSAGGSTDPCQHGSADDVTRCRQNVFFGQSGGK